MQANKYAAFKNVKSNNVQAILNSNNNMYMYLNPAQAGCGDCLVFDVVGVMHGYNVSYYGYVNGVTIHTKTILIPSCDNIASYITSIINKYA